LDIPNDLCRGLVPEHQFIFVEGYRVCAQLHFDVYTGQSSEATGNGGLNDNDVAWFEAWRLCLGIPSPWRHLRLLTFVSFVMVDYKECYQK
jgi:hypothetical protein